MKPTIHHNTPNREEFLRLSKKGNDSNWKDDPFVTDAIEGTKLLSNPKKSLKNLDKRFIANNWGIPLVGVTLLLFGIVVFFAWDTKNQKHSEVNLPSKLSNLQNDIKSNLKKTTQLASNTMKLKEKVDPVKKNRSDQSMDQSVLPVVEEENIDLLTLPLTLPLVKEEIRLKLTKTGKEIYLHKLKTVDYRVYRSASKPSSKPLELTGTPASENTLLENELSSDSITYISYITASMKDVQIGAYRSAISKFNVILKTYPTDVNALFYNGFCYFQLSEFEKALTYFRQTELGGFDNFEEESEWYQFKCYQQLKDVENIKRLSIKIKNRKGFYSDRVN